MKLVSKILFSLIASFVVATSGWAKEDPVYDVARIAPELLENAEAVVRISEVIEEIQSPSKMTSRNKRAITILKESALEDATLALPYSKFVKVDNLEAVVYDSKGVKVKRIKTEDILDYSAIDGNSIYSDNRVKVIDPRYQTYPFTVEYTFTYSLASALYCSGFSLFEGYNKAIEKKTYQLTVPESYAIKYKELNGVSPVTISKSEGKVVYVWECRNFLARNPELLAPASSETYPNVKIACSQFELDGYKGSSSSWTEYGKFVSSLLVGKDNLPASTASRVQELVKDCKTDFEKIRKIYEFGQQKNRYINVTVGIGGLQPFDAETVDRLSYGDCKALSNYNKALLNAVGIKAYYTVIESDKIPTSIEDDFVYNVFNHIVLCVPVKNDTIWLECTNSQIPCGYFGDWVHNRKALLIDGVNSKLVNTNLLDSKCNQVITNAEFNLDITGNGTAKYQSKNTGIEYWSVLGLKTLDEVDRRKQIIAGINIPNFKLINYKIDEVRERNPEISVTMDLDITNCATIMGQKMMFKLNQNNPVGFIPPFARKREAQLQLVNDHVEKDTTIFHLPGGVKIESLPNKVDIETIFGSYHSSCEMVGNSIKYTRALNIKRGKYKPELYNSFREFLEKVAAADNSKCIIQKPI